MEISLNIIGYKDHLKRISQIIVTEIKDNLKKIDFIEDHHPGMSEGQFNTQDLEDELYTLQPIIPMETSIRDAENTVKTLKVILHELRSLINTFEDNHGIHYELELAKTLSKRGGISPEQTNPSDLSSLPYFGNVGGKKRKSKKKKVKRKKTKKH